MYPSGGGSGAGGPGAAAGGTTMGSRGGAHSSTHQPSLRSAQASLLRRVLALKGDAEEDQGDRHVANGGSSEGLLNDWSDEWKVLVYDAVGRDIFSSVLHVGDLRQEGVTLHLLIDGEREAIPDVPVVYFCAPTQRNIHYMVQDMKDHKYQQFHIAFISETPRYILEEFAASCLEYNVTGLVGSIRDVYTEFVSLTTRLFTLHRKGTFTLMNHPSTEEAHVVTYMRSVADSLLSVCASIGEVPVMLCPNDGAAQMLGDRLSEKLREKVAQQRAGNDPLFPHHSASFGGVHGPSNEGYSSRPLLILLDRTTDISSVLSHPSSYSGLVDDIFGIHGNRVLAPKEISGEAAADHLQAIVCGHVTKGQEWYQKKHSVPKIDKNTNSSDWVYEHCYDMKSPNPFIPCRSHDLDPERDYFWRRYGSAAFPEAIEAHGRELSDVTSSEEKIRQDASNSGIDLSNESELDGGAAMEGKHEGLASAVGSLPALLRRKGRLEAHTHLLQSVMTAVASRSIPTFFEAETEQSARTQQASVYNLLGVPEEEIKKLAGGKEGAGAPNPGINLDKINAGSGTFTDRLRLACIYLVSPDARPLGSKPPHGKVELEGSKYGANDIAFSWEQSTPLPARCCEELIAVLRASAAAHIKHSSTLNTSTMENSSKQFQPPAPSAAEVDKSMSVLRYVASHRTMTRLAGNTDHSQVASSSGDISSNKWLSALTSQTSSAVSQLLSKASAQMKNLVGSDSTCSVTKIVSAAMEGKKSSNALQKFGKIDPLDEDEDKVADERGNVKYSTAIVFVMGGGSYMEYNDLQRWAARASSSSLVDYETEEYRDHDEEESGRSRHRGSSLDQRRTKVYYGSTELVSGETFLSQLAALGDAIQQ